MANVDHGDPSVDFDFDSNLKNNKNKQTNKGSCGGGSSSSEKWGLSFTHLPIFLYFHQNIFFFKSRFNTLNWVKVSESDLYPPSPVFFSLHRTHLCFIWFFKWVCKHLFFTPSFSCTFNSRKNYCSHFPSPFFLTFMQIIEFRTFRVNSAKISTSKRQILTPEVTKVLAGNLPNFSPPSSLGHLKLCKIHSHKITVSDSLQIKRVFNPTSTNLNWTQVPHASTFPFLSPCFRHSDTHFYLAGFSIFLSWDIGSQFRSHCYFFIDLEFIYITFIDVVGVGGSASGHCWKRQKTQKLRLRNILSNCTLFKV